MTSIEYKNSSSSSQQIRRYMIKRDKPAAGLWPFGWLLLIALLLFFLYGLFVVAPQIESDIQNRVVKALHALGVDNVLVEADGQEVLVKGTYLISTANNLEQEKSKIKMAVLGSTCDTLLMKDMICPTTVRVDLHEQPPENIARLHDFKITRSGANIVLEGEVSDLMTHQGIVARATETFTSSKIIDKLHITDEAATSAYLWAVGRSWSILKPMKIGVITWQEGKFSAWGEVSETEEQVVREAFSSEDHTHRLGTIDLKVAKVVNVTKDIGRCNKDFEGLLSKSSIQFQTASAEISDQSYVLLNGLAELANECNIDLLIEGHTDNQGHPVMNQKLSLARAVAVADALGELGVNRSSLKSLGHGDERPRADNGSAEGRALNRRIEIKAVEENSSQNQNKTRG